MRSMTLRLSDETHERLRRQAFVGRTTITALVVAAIEAAAPRVPGGCDQCGRPATRVTTPGGFRFCDDHGGRASADVPTGDQS